MKQKGFFITFEGGEGAGKSTLIKSLSNYLTSKGKKVLTTFEPGATDFGKNIRSTLLDIKSNISAETELFLYLADRAYHVEKIILPALADGKIILCDRFTDSSVAYQGGGRGFISLEQVENMSLISTKGLIPNLTFYLDVAPEFALERITRSKDRLESEDITFHKKVRQGYLMIAKKNPQRVVVLDAKDTKEQVYEQAIKKLDFYMDLN
jgi:dTMP kinase